MLAASKSIPDRKFFLQFALIALSLTIGGVVGLQCVGCAVPGFHERMVATFSPNRVAFQADKEPAAQIPEGFHPPIGLPSKHVKNLPAAGDLPFEIKSDTLRLVSKDGAQVVELTVFPGGLMISVADLKKQLVRHQPVILIAPPPADNKAPAGDAPDDGRFNLNEEPKVTRLEDPRRRLLFEP